MKRCRHIWKVDKTETQPSPVEQLQANGPMKSISATSTALYVKPVIVYRHCIACGTEDVARV